VRGSRLGELGEYAHDSKVVALRTWSTVSVAARRRRRFGQVLVQPETKRLVSACLSLDYRLLPHIPEKVAPRMTPPWGRSLVLQVALWSRAYLGEDS
jgi:hypothetical protein